jgi:putative MATE family efflux protein
MSKTKLDTRSRSQVLGEDSISSLLIRFSLPAVVGMLVNALYNFVDSLFISRVVGPHALAGVNISFPIMLISMAIAMLVGIGSTSLLSLKLGEGKQDEGEKIIGNGFTLIIILASVFTLLGLIFLTPLLRAIGGTPESLPHAKDYLSIILWGNVFQSIGFSMNNYIRAEGNPRVAMFTMLIGAFINIGLDALFIYVFDMGVRGAALATIISQMVSAAWVLSYFFTGRSQLKLKLVNMRLNPYYVRRILTLGAAPFALQIAASLMNLILNISLKNYGGVDAATYQGSVGAVARISTLLLMPIFGINQGVQPIIGFNYGAQKYRRVKEALKLGVISATVIVTVGYVITRLFPDVLINMFVDKKADYDPSLFIRFGKHTIKAYYFFMPIVGYQIISSNFFQAIGKPVKAATLTLSRQLLFLIPLLIFLPMFFGIDGIVYSIPTADVLSSILTTILLFFEIRQINQKQREIEEQEFNIPLDGLQSEGI